MQNQLIQILSQPALGGIGLILTVLFGITSLVLYQKQKLHKNLWYYVEKSNIFGVASTYISDIGLDGVEIDKNLKGAREVFTVTIWNRGKSTIEGKSISPEDPLVLVLPQSKQIRKATIKTESRKAVSAKVQIQDSKSAAALTFQFLDWRDGFEVQLMTVESKDAKEQVKRGIVERLTFKRHRSTVQLAGTVMGLNQLSELHPIPMTGEITAIFLGADILLALAIGIAFSIFAVIPYQVGLALAAKYAAPGFIFFVGLTLIWAAFYAWHFRFFPNTSRWFRHELKTPRARQSHAEIGVRE